MWFSGAGMDEIDPQFDTCTRVLGIDPGLNCTGYGVLESQGACQRPGVVEAGVIRGGSSSKPLAERVAVIHRGIKDVIKSFAPQAMALEELYSHYDRPRTSILMGHARGVTCLAAAEAGIPVVSYAATRVKKLLTGSGRASKSQMQLAVQRELSLAELPEPADVADALAIALGHFYLRNRRSDVEC
ncbi:MAG: crossover junction endodeoxyribonuclease RuvC [Pirellulales bacterium]|nr:crossover junction endodeoxyribonuclease RuvC [Pirellulales bacterium]